MTDTCRDCGAGIRWATTTSGRAMPVDVVPDPLGNVAVQEAPGGRLTVRVLGRFDTPGPDEVRRSCHLDTCPDRTPRRTR